MKPETEQIVATIEVLTDGLYCSCVGDELYGVMAWEVEEKGEFSFLRFFLEVQALTLLRADEFSDRVQQFQHQETIKEYRELIKFLEANLSELQFYSYQAPYLSEEHTNFYCRPEEIEFVIIGSTLDGEWLALVPTRLQTKPTPTRFTIPSQKPTEATAKSIEKIQYITGDLVRKNREGKIVKQYPRWQIAVACNPSNAVEKVLDLAGYINIYEIDYFWDVGHPSETSEYYDWRMQEFQLKQFFKEELIDGRAYYLYFDGGEYQVHYVLGKNKNEDWFGVFTDTYSW